MLWLTWISVSSVFAAASSTLVLFSPLSTSRPLLVSIQHCLMLLLRMRSRSAGSWSRNFVFQKG